MSRLHGVWTDAIVAPLGGGHAGFLLSAIPPFIGFTGAVLSRGNTFPFLSALRSSIPGVLLLICIWLWISAITYVMIGLAIAVVAAAC